MAGKATPTPAPKRPSRDRRRRTAIIAMIAVAVVATVVLIVRFAARHAATAAAKTQQAAVSAPPAAPSAAPAPAPPQHPRLASKPAAEKHVAEKAPAPAAKSAKPANAPSSGTSSNMLIVANGPAPAPAPAIAPTAADAASQAHQTPVTITGCLETTVEETEFRLTDTEGADVPKSRSWKSGFLKKSATPVALVGFSDPAPLKKLVGRRVSATGMLTSGELHLRSYKPAGASCSN